MELKHYTFKLHLRDGEVQGGAVGYSYGHALMSFKMQEQVKEFIEKYGPVVREEFISEEDPEDATPEAAKNKGLESLAIATTARLEGIQDDALYHRKRIGEELKDARKEYGATIEEVASHCMLKPVTIRNIEAGKFSADIDLLSKIASYYSCEIGVCDKE